MDTHAPRKPWLAAAASMMLPGFGQFYNGQLNRSIWILCAFVSASLPMPTLAALYLPSALILPCFVLSVSLTLGIWGYSMAHAWRSAAHMSTYQRKSWQQSAAYLCAFLTGIGLLMMTTQYLQTHYIASYNIPSKSMQPSVLQGDILFADKRYNCPGCKHHAQRGDIAIFVYPNNRSQYYIKRIIALPGDRVKIERQTLYVNGTPLALPAQAQTDRRYITEHNHKAQYQVQWTDARDTPMDEIVVPPGAAFVLGDNRSKSRDSRTFGTVPLTDIVGKARQVWWSWGDEGVRWSRLGKVLQ